jgi:hypothetical protein
MSSERLGRMERSNGQLAVIDSSLSFCERKAQRRQDGSFFGK